ncbi:MAG TPA: hypothetical protein VGR26_16275 [Acidimicrobiales bacterium]|nr:hypothetical protein [Acidimicrobiales bacterium]
MKPPWNFDEHLEEIMETNESHRPRRRQRTARTAVFVGALATGLLAVAGTSGAGGGRSGEAGLQAVRSLTKRYQNEAAALAAGYMRTDECVPGMGYHYVNPGLVDDKLQPSRPEVLLFVPTADGGRVLAGAEWLVVDDDQDLRTDADRPSVFGHPFDGPMPGHGPGMPIHYDLHAWAWLDNPAGGFATFNSNIVCPPHEE